MKVLKLLITGLVLILAGTLQAQVSVNVTLPTPPPWGPVGYSEARYYYLPDVEAYYDVPSSMFIYNERGAWIHRSYLPGRYRNYDLYSGYKVVMSDYHGDTPYKDFKEHKMKYGRGYHREAQRTIGERPGRGNSGEKMSRGVNHGNKEGGRGNNRNAGRGNDKGGSHGNGKNMKEGHGKGGGKDKRK
jgi:hypothetical protein